MLEPNKDIGTVCLFKGCIYAPLSSCRRQLEAISRLSRLVDPSSPFEQLLRCCVVGTPGLTQIAEMPPVWVRDAAWREEVRKQLKNQQGLNNSQRR